MTKYEYDVIANVYYLKEEFLNTLGKEGWELISHTYTGEPLGTKHVYTFKREVIEEVDKGDLSRYNEALSTLAKMKEEREENDYLEKHRKEYEGELKTGMFFEWHPEWTGEWRLDKYAYARMKTFGTK